MRLAIVIALVVTLGLLALTVVVGPWLTVAASLLAGIAVGLRRAWRSLLLLFGFAALLLVALLGLIGLWGVIAVFALLFLSFVKSSHAVLANKLDKLLGRLGLLVVLQCQLFGLLDRKSVV